MFMGYTIADWFQFAAGAMFAIWFYCRIIRRLKKHCEDCESFRDMLEEGDLAT